MASLIRTLSLGLVIIAVTLHTAAAYSATYPLAQPYGGLESTLSDNEIIFYDHAWINGGPGCDNTGSLGLQGMANYYGDLDNTDGSLTFTDTMSFFIDINISPNGYGPIIEYYSTSGGQGLRLELDAVGIHVYTPSDTVSSFATPVSPATWHSIGFTYNSGVLSMYLDCVLIHAQANININTNFDTIRFGLHVMPTGASSYFSGQMACARFDSDVLDAATIAALCPGSCPCERVTITPFIPPITPSPSPCEDCLCYEDNCYDVGYDYCHKNQCSNCDTDHCCCCEKDMEKCIDKPCICIDDINICSDLDMDVCYPLECEGHCEGAQCCCTKEVQCPVWSECHCMVQKCSEVDNLHDCDRCCSDCKFGHCCCCDKDDPVCPKDHECHCQGRSCDEIAGYGYCDPSKCAVTSDGFFNRYWANYVCPSDQCCCKMDTGTCADGLSCTCEEKTCWELHYDYCDCEDVPGCKREHCCCPRQVPQCPYEACTCLKRGTCESFGISYCNPAVCGPQCDPKRCCCPFPA